MNNNSIDHFAAVTKEETTLWLENEAKRIVQNDILGTCEPLFSFTYLLESKAKEVDFELTDDDAEDVLEQASIEEEIVRCAGCSWWVRVEETIDQDGEHICSDCTSETDDE